MGRWGVGGGVWGVGCGRWGVGGGVWEVGWGRKGKATQRLPFRAVFGLFGRGVINSYIKHILQRIIYQVISQ